MNRRRVSRAAVLTAALILPVLFGRPADLLAQQGVTTGSIVGRIVDNTGAPLAGATVTATTLTDQYTFANYQADYGERALLLFVISPGERLAIVTTEPPGRPRSGQTIVSLLLPAAAGELRP